MQRGRWKTIVASNMAGNYGLIAKTTKENVPLEGVKVSALVTGYTAQVTAKMEYKNTEENPIEAIYIFPLDQQAAVCGFQATIEGRTIIAEIREKNQARDEYDDAISSGHSAFLLEESDESSDIFKMNIGNLPPKQTASVELTFVTELEVDDQGSVKFALPTVLNPRYTPTGHEPSITTQIPVSTVAKPYTFDLELSVKSGSPIKSIESPSNKLHVKRDVHDNHSVRVTLAEPHQFGRDVEVHILNEEPFKPRALIENGLPPPIGSPDTPYAAGKDSVADGFLANPVVMVNFVPAFTAENLRSGEFIFIVDRSGSMNGDRINKTAHALQLFLKSLPDACYFNIIGFGNRFERLFNKSVLYNDKTLEKATKHAEHLEANLGGTEILEPLKWVCSQPVLKDSPRQVFILTDGEVGNTNEVISLVATHADKIRVFAFGIGDGASTELVKGVARAGNGAAEFVRDKDNLQAKVIKTLKRAMQPALTGTKLTWTVPEGWKILNVSDTLPPVFKGDRMIVYGCVRTEENGKKESETKAEATIEATLHQGSETKLVRESVEFELPGKSTESTHEKSSVLHLLAAKMFISSRQHLLSSTPAKDDIIKVSLAASIVSKFTSFIAVDEESRESVKGAMVKRVVPMPYKMQSAQCCSAIASFGGGGFQDSSSDDAMMDPVMDDTQWLTMKAVDSTPMCENLLVFSSDEDGVGDRGVPSELISSLFGKQLSGISQSSRSRSSDDEESCKMICDDAMDDTEDISPPISTNAPAAYSAPKSKKSKFSSLSKKKAATPVLRPGRVGDSPGKEKREKFAIRLRRKASPSSSSASSSRAEEAADPLMSLVNFQLAKGSWELTSELASCLNTTQDALVKGKPPTITEEAWATALVLAWLFGRFSDRKDEWEMIAEKGERWLKSALVSGEYGHVIAEANNALNM